MMRDLVKLYFNDHSIVNHHIASFNDFIYGSENGTSRMQKILDDLRVTPNDERGVLKLDPEKTNGKIVEIRFGRKRDEDDKVIESADRTIMLEKPKAIEATGAVEELTPLQARIRNRDYNADIKVLFSLIVNGQEVRQEWLTVGSIPMMVKSRGCNISREAMEENGKISDAEYEKRLIELKEDPKDPGGYFIIGGAEKVLITLEDLAPNRIMVEREEKYGVSVETAKIFSQRDGYRALTLVQKKKDGIMTVSVPAINNSIPLIALMKALGMESDEEIYNTIVSCEEMELIVMANIEDSIDIPNPKNPNNPEKRFHTTADALTYLKRNYAPGQAKDYQEKKIDGILDRSLLPHLGGTPEDRKKKAIFLGRIARSVLELYFEIRRPDDKDHYANKRLKLAGDLMEDLFRTSFASFMADMKYQSEKNWGRKRDGFKIDSAIRKDVLKNKLVHAVATGNWVGGRSGVSQLLDRTSNMSAMSHLRRITSSLTRSQPHFEARDLHPTQWGRLCPSETPEGQNCGLVKNAALIIDVSESTSAEDVEQILMDLGMTEIVVEANSNASKQKTRIYINGNLVGSHDDPNKFVESIRERRRSRAISQQINIHYDRDMNEVIINCDEGRLKRPLLIVKDGRTMLTRKDLEAIREHKMSWNELFNQGIMEWVDAEEEEDTLIAVDAFTVPVRCEECGRAISSSDVDWMNPGKPGDVVLRCNHCNHEMVVPTNLTKKHTHMEIDPMVILGVAAGLIPYPEHNSSPRVTLGAAMAKQALGVATGNYRIRPDTRGHLLHYPQKPMVQTQTMEFMKYNDRPAGQNFCIAVLSYHGYNIEDALVMNKSSVQRGLGRSTFMRTYITEEERYGAVQSAGPNSYVNKDKFEIPFDVVGVREESAYANLDDRGIISPEIEVKGRDVLVGKTSPPRFLGEDINVLTPQKRREASITVRPGERGYVDSVLLTESPEGAKLVNIKVRSQRVPEPGDKFCSRHGQKGVIGRLVDQCDMPFTADGITPDLVVNPHGIPSRMTIAHVLEMIGGKVGSMEGRTIDGTVFSGEREESIRDGLVKNGFKHTGKEVMYDGKTGKRIEMDIYTGVIFYEKLHHMVSGKMHMRSRGPTQILTRQPTEGRSRLGGLRFGEMERDCLIGHGVSMVIKDRLLDQSDGRKQYVCGNPNCGHIAVVDARGARYCPVCKDSTNIYPVETSYAFKLLMDELLSMGVAMRLQLEDLR